MSLKGNASANDVLMGRINRADKLVVNAYEIAVKNGFNGTEEQWLESLRPDGGYHAAQHANGGSDPITPGMIGAAPAGYGLGEYVASFAILTSADVALKTGRYRVSSGGTGVPVTGILGVDAFSDTYCRQSLYGVTNGNILHRTDINGTWGEWEYENPPMVVGVEYRTTERYKGNPVYTKLIDFGALPNATTKSVAVVSGATMVYTPVSLDAFVSDGFSKYPLPYISKDGGMATISFGGTVVTIETTSDMSNCTATVLLKYTKG